jgi:hypothetical protein
MTPQESFGQWTDENYELVGVETNQMAYRCRRCGAEVGYLTKHAALRHGDPIEVMPATTDDPTLAESY